MAWSPTTTPPYSYGIMGAAPVALSANAYAPGGTPNNTTKIYAADNARRPAFSQISLLPVGALSAGKFLLLVSATAGGTALTEIDEIVNASQSGYSTTASGTLLTFTRWSSTSPLILPETADLYIASTVAQGTPPVAYANGKLF